MMYIHNGKNGKIEEEIRMKQAIIGLAALVAGCGSSGLNAGENAAQLCSGARVEFADYGYKVMDGEWAFFHIESYNGPDITMEVPDGCSNRLEQKKGSPWNFRMHIDKGCNGSVDFFYEEFGRRSGKEPVIQEPAGSVEATRYYSEFFEMDVPKAEELWREWKQKGGN